MPMMGITDPFVTNAGPLRERQVPIACSVWFTSNGRLIPLSIKWKDEDGMLRMLHNIRIITVSERNYCGIPSTEFACESEYCGARVPFRLLYYAARSEWKLLWHDFDKKKGDGS